MFYFFPISPHLWKLVSIVPPVAGCRQEPVPQLRDLRPTWKKICSDNPHSDDSQSRRTGRHERSQCCCCRRGRPRRGRRRGRRWRPFSSVRGAARTASLRRGTRKPCEIIMKQLAHLCCVIKLYVSLTLNDDKSCSLITTTTGITNRKIRMDNWTSRIRGRFLT